MYDSRQFLQFVVERKLGFDHDRSLGFDLDRELIFDHERELMFDVERDLTFGRFGPVFRGRACPSCSQLVHPLENECRACGTRVQPVHKPPTKRKRPSRAEKRKERSRRKARREEITICPNCALKIPGDSVYCPRCRVKIDEWREYLEKLRQWEEQAQRGGRPQQRYGEEYWRR